MRYSELILDLDGPLLDGQQRHYRCYADIVNSLGGLPLAIAEYWCRKRSGCDRRELLAASGIGSNYQAFLSRWIERIEEREYLVWDRMQPNVKSTLESWQREGRRIILVTMRQNDDNLRAQLSNLGLTRYFTKIIRVGFQKGGQKKALEVRQQVLDLQKNRALWIGDTEIDSDAGRELGVAVALLDCGLRNWEQLAMLRPDYLEHDLRALSLNGVAMG